MALVAGQKRSSPAGSLWNYAQSGLCLKPIQPHSMSRSAAKQPLPPPPPRQEQEQDQTQRDSKRNKQRKSAPVESDADAAERAHFEEVLQAYEDYERYMMFEIARRERHAAKLPARYVDRLPKGCLADKIEQSKVPFCFCLLLPDMPRAPHTHALFARCASRPIRLS